MKYLNKIYKVIKNNIKKIFSVSLITFIVVFMTVSFFSSPQYETSTELIVQYEKTGEETGMDAINASRNLASIYQDMIDNRSTYTEIKEAMGLQLSNEEIKEIYTIEVKDKTPIISIKAISKNRETSKKYIEEMLHTTTISHLFEEKSLAYVRDTSVYQTKKIEKSPITASVLASFLIFLVGWIGVFIKNAVSSFIISTKQVEEVTDQKVSLVVNKDVDDSVLHFSELVISDYIKNKKRVFLMNTFSSTNLVNDAEDMISSFGYNVGYFKIIGSQKGWNIIEPNSGQQIYELSKEEILDLNINKIDIFSSYDIILFSTRANNSPYSYNFARNVDYNYVLVSQSKTKDVDLSTYISKCQLFEISIDRICLVDYTEKEDIY